jgi:DNA protecting protein DprA
VYNSNNIDEQENSAVCAFLLALNMSGDFSSTKVCRRIRRSITEGFCADLLRDLSKTLDSSSWIKAQREVELAHVHGIDVINLFDCRYPKKLREIADPPLVLFVRGTLLTDFSVAMVGTRRCTQYGRRIAAALSREITRLGGCVVSGLAFGIDASAHRGAVEAKAADDNAALTAGVAVLGSGVLNPTPVAQQGLAEALLSCGGALISEYGMLTEARPYFFPRRNRIVSGLSDVVIVVEAPDRSGALITSDFALEQGREVYAVPGPIDEPASSGTNQLIRQGANVLTSADDIIELFPAETMRSACVAAGRRSRHDSGAVPLSSLLAKVVSDEHERQVAQVLVEEIREQRTCNLDYLVNNLQCSAAELGSLLARLELEGIIEVTEEHGYRLLLRIDS